MVEPSKHAARTDDEIAAHTIGELKPLTGPIVLCEYDPEWPASFAREAVHIRAIPGARMKRLEHVGSTSVVGLPAKPIEQMLLFREAPNGLVRIAALAALGFSCAHSPSTRAASDAPTAASVPSISLSEIKPGQWKAILRTARPTVALRFDRTPDDPRSRRWQAEPGLELVHEDGMDVLRRKDHASFQTASVNVPALYIAQAKEYPPFLPYSDGGLLIYTGQFHICAAPSACPNDDRWPIEVTPPPGAHVLVNGILHESAFTFTDTGDGTNIYVGKSEPLSSYLACALASHSTKTPSCRRRLISARSTPPLSRAGWRAYRSQIRFIFCKQDWMNRDSPGWPK
jgi:hypothetical protein